jgi:hypothetical protein
MQGRNQCEDGKQSPLLEETCSSETSVDVQWITRRYIPNKRAERKDAVYLHLCLVASATSHTPISKTTHLIANWTLLKHEACLLEKR